MKTNKNNKNQTILDQNKLNKFINNVQNYFILKCNNFNFIFKN